MLFRYKLPWEKCHNISRYLCGFYFMKILFKKLENCKHFPPLFPIMLLLFVARETVFVRLLCVVRLYVVVLHLSFHAHIPL